MSVFLTGFAVKGNGAEPPGTPLEMQANKDAGQRWQRATDAEIRRRLTPEQYEVTQHEGTEAPSHNACWN